MIFLYVIQSILIYFIKDKINNYVYGLISIYFAIAGIYICINIFRNIKRSIFMDTFKKYTFQIYLMHTIFAAGIRIILLKSGITKYLIHFLLGIIFSIYIPVLISIISNKIVYTNYLFYPIRTMEELKERKKKHE